MYGASGGRTPLYGSATPSYGGATPRYGGSAASEGGRTPGATGIWDPTLTNTPAHESMMDDYYAGTGVDDDSPSMGGGASPSPSSSHSTGFSSSSASNSRFGSGGFGGDAYTPGTPAGSQYTSDHSYSPYPGSSSPSAAYQRE
jgi:transcription elongation factor SPT5